MRVDAAAYLGAWPFRGNVEGTLSGLSAAMRECQADAALVSPLPALLHNDPAPANDRLMRRLRSRPGVWAVPVVNPLMPSAARYVTRLAGLRQVRGIRLAPGFHGYGLEDALEVVRAASDCGLTVVVQLRVQDERSHLAAFRIPPVPLAEAIALGTTVPAARVVVAAARTSDVVDGEIPARIRAARSIWLDTSHLDGLDCIRQVCRAAGAARLLMASCWPFFYARSAALKVAEAKLSRRDAAAVTGRNATRAFRLSAADCALD